MNIFEKLISIVSRHEQVTVVSKKKVVQTVKIINATVTKYEHFKSKPDKIAFDYNATRYELTNADLLKRIKNAYLNAAPVTETILFSATLTIEDYCGFHNNVVTGNIVKVRR